MTSDLSAVSAASKPGAPNAARASSAAPLLLRKPAAAEVMAMSVDSFERYVQPEIRVVRRGALVLVPVIELERWIEREAARTLGDER
jgi:hypothetical protein